MNQKIELFEKQLQFYNLKTREALLEAGIGYGKSRVASIWLAAQTQNHPHSNWIMAARDYRQLSTSIDREFEFYLHDIFGLKRNIDYRKTNGSPIEYHFLKSNSRIFGHSAVNYDTAFRAGNYNGAWGDEVDFWKPAAVKALRGRIRVWPEFIRWTSSPYGYNHVYDDFYEKKLGPVVNATSFENPTLSQEFFNSLRDSYTERMFKQEVLAERLNITQDGIYYAFNRERHMGDVRHNDFFPIYVGIDFNVLPMSAALFQIIDDKAVFFDEVYISNRQSNTQEVCDIIKNKYGTEGVTFVPDSTGIKSTTNANRSDIQIIKDSGFKVLNAHNPFRIDRYNVVNYLFEKNKIIIDNKLKALPNDFEKVSYKEGTNLVDDSDKMLTHISDGAGYGLFRTMNPFKNKSKSFNESKYA